MKKLALAVSLCPLWLFSCAVQDSGASQPAGTPAGPASGPRASSALEVNDQGGAVFSARDALIGCLRAVKGASGTAGIGIQSLSSQLLPPVGDSPPRAAVEMKLVFQAEDQEAADRAFEGARAALAGLSRSGMDPVTYEDSKASFVSLSTTPGTVMDTVGQSLDRPLMTHEATLRTELSTRRFRPASDGSESAAMAVPIRSVQRYVRSVAASDQVLLPVAIASRRPTAVGMQSFEIRPDMDAAEGDSDASIDRARIANFMHLLEANSKKVQITAVEMGDPEGESFKHFKARFNVPR